METPSSIRMISRSSAKDFASSMSNKISVSRKNEENFCDKERNNDRWALVDITNDSPIVGLASGSLVGTPSSLLKKRNHHHHPKQTPGSGEALLRGQVKILLQKVEEEAEPHHQHSSGLGLAPTPTNTPNLPSEIVVNEESQEALVVFDESERCDVTRSLLFDDFLDDLSSCSSVLTQGSVFVEKSAEDEQFQRGEEDYYDYEEEEEGLSKMFVQEKPPSGCQGEEVTHDDDDSSPAVSNNNNNTSGIFSLNGPPTPQGREAED